MTFDLGFWLTTIRLLLDMVGAYTLVIFDLPRRGREGMTRKARLVDIVQAKVIDWKPSEKPKFRNLDAGLQKLTEGRVLEPGSPTFNDLNKIVFGGQVQPDSLLKQRQEIVRIYYDSDNREVVFDVESNMPLREASDQRQSIDDVEQLCDNYARQRTARAGSRLLILGFVFLLAANVYGAGF